MLGEKGTFLSKQKVNRQGAKYAARVPNERSANWHSGYRRKW